ncbi:chloramphenicol acetyltransferase [Flavobacterium sp. AC]|uniref:Chloramphenicol acetyltransferase n=1 Tax=Flavobacterium azizsancarii TaxID=2961580 RepID=A0ABT4W725_9FLAO|nr:CatA-like O-acetyltransferase [Flavobacterium azizsancarii]MDA6068338.1 chloramphenicol acetyltransferase [Flavobacterium azizsancarii]
MENFFEPVDPESWERQPYFDYFNNIIKCKYTINANVDITELLQVSKGRKLKFFPSFLYVIMRSVNQNKEFRMSYNDQYQLGYWNYVVPSYTIFHEDDKTFSDVWSEYHEDFKFFYETIVGDIEKYKDVKGIKARLDRPANFCSISALPWLSFTNFSQDTYQESNFMFPLIRFGKYFKQDDRILIPVAVFVNHAVADGYHTSKLINDMQDFAKNAEDWML